MTTNIDQTEIDKFSSIASRWWDPNSEFKPLHEINPLRLGYVDQRAGLAGKKVLDVGCGGGILAEGMAAAGATVTGIDLAAASLEVADLHLLESGLEVEYREVPVEQLAEERPGEYDIVTCMEMLEHVPDPQSVVRACATLIKPGGQVFFSTLNRNAKSYALAILGAEYLLQMLPKGTHDYAKFIKPSELARWGRAADLEFRHSTGIRYNPLGQSYKLDPHDLDVNYILHMSRPAA